MKTTKKRLAKIEKNEELQSQGHTLDADQLRSLSQKAILVEFVKELEDLQKQLEEVEIEEEKNLKKLQKKQAGEEAKRIQQVKVGHLSLFLFLFLFLFSFSSCFFFLSLFDQI